MPPSPLCTVNGSATADGFNASAGAALTIQLVDLSARSWSLAVFGVDDSQTFPGPALSINPTTRTATATAPALGTTTLFRSTVIDGQGNSYSTTFAVYVLASNGNRVIAFGETTEGGSLAGWINQLNAQARALTNTPGFATLVAPPAAATFTANAGNGSGAALADISGGGLLLTGAKGASDDSKNAGFYRAKSGAKTLTVCMRFVLTDTGGVAGANAAVGLYFAEAATGRIKVFRSFAGALPQQLFFNSYTNPTTAVGGGAVLGVGIGNTFWLRLADDGTNIVASYSTNGKNWTQAASEARGTFLTTTPGGDRMGVFAAGFSSAVQAEILSYAET